MTRFEFRTCVTRDTEYSADSVEWCPVENLTNVLVCGTYQLDGGVDTPADESVSAKVRRKGRILLYRLNLDDDGENRLELIETLETSAVLDQKWRPNGDATLAVVSADGTVKLYRLSDSVQLVAESTVTVGSEDEQEKLALSVDWKPDGSKLVASDSKGGLTVIDAERREQLATIHHWNAHTFEAWTTAFSRHQENVLFSGGDDGVLRLYDLRCWTEPLMKAKNGTHNAGVTSLLSCVDRDHSLVTGSYDDHVRLFDERQLKRNVSELNVGGGVWRLKADPHHQNNILCACMYHNFSIVQLSSSDQFDIVGEYFEHGSICYGCDWRTKGHSDDKAYVATCSFYDHKLCVAEIEAIS